MPSRDLYFIRSPSSCRYLPRSVQCFSCPFAHTITLGHSFLPLFVPHCIPLAPFFDVKPNQVCLKCLDPRASALAPMPPILLQCFPQDFRTFSLQKWNSSTVNRNSCPLSCAVFISCRQSFPHPHFSTFLSSGEFPTA